MSSWTHITGTITVSPLGRSQPEMRYILEMVLAHLPKVSGSEGDMQVQVLQKPGHDCWQSHDEFGQWSNLKRNGWFEQQGNYILVINSDLRDTTLSETVRNFTKWLCRLARRLRIQDITIHERFRKMYERPSWCFDSDSNEPSWAEAFMYETVKGDEYPMLLAYKYYTDEENDKEVERRMKWRKKRKYTKRKPANS